MVREIDRKGEQRASGSGHQQTEPVHDGWSAWLGPIAGAAAFTGVPVGGTHFCICVFGSASVGCGECV
jgi:hypothetical protein